jgi:pSer/pThr/pTyr-binding forkhead associated (FHA) protein
MATNGGKSCPNCGTEIPTDFSFCGKCGTRVDAGSSSGGTAGGSAKTMFFGASQSPGRAKLIVIKGEGVDGVSYQLAGTEHIAGRLDGAILFPDDPLMSPRHANFIYRDSRLYVRDDGSVNGVFTRIKTPTSIPSGGLFLIGEQLLQVEPSPPDLGPQPDAEGTYFYASPKRPSKMKLIQRLRGGEIGMIYRARGETITIGREGNDVNFLDDPFISGRHAQIEIAADGQMTISDLGSKNGTFVRIADETPLAHGDYVFLGQQLLRVEIS